MPPDVLFCQYRFYIAQENNWPLHEEIIYSNLEKICYKLPYNKFPGSSVVEQAAVNRSVAGSNPARGAILKWSILETWYTDYTGDMVYKLEANGLIIGSNLQVVSSKYPKSYFIKDTSQILSSV